jgi:hypothetical protein
MNFRKSGCASAIAVIGCGYTRRKLTVCFEHGWSGPAQIGFRDQVYTFSQRDRRESALSSG